MADERITETTDAQGNVRTTHIITNEQPRRGGLGVLGIFLILALAGLAALFIFTRMGDAEIAKDTAVADAANEVSEAANEVGAAASEAAEDVDEAISN